MEADEKVALSPSTNRLPPHKTNCSGSLRRELGDRAEQYALAARGGSQTFSVKGFSHHRRSIERSALAIASAILFMPSGRFEPKPA